MFTAGAHIIDIGSVGLCVAFLLAVVHDEVDGQESQQQHDDHVHDDACQVHSQSN